MCVEIATFHNSWIVCSMLIQPKLHRSATSTYIPFSPFTTDHRDQLVLFANIFLFIIIAINDWIHTQKSSSREHPFGMKTEFLSEIVDTLLQIRFKMNKSSRKSAYSSKKFLCVHGMLYAAYDNDWLNKRGLLLRNEKWWFPFQLEKLWFLFILNWRSWWGKQFQFRDYLQSV